jgi:hypothetical protein
VLPACWTFYGGRPGQTAGMLQENVAPGVHRIEDAYTNWYLV